MRPFDGNRVLRNYNWNKCAALISFSGFDIYNLHKSMN